MRTTTTTIRRSAAGSASSSKRGFGRQATSIPAPSAASSPTPRAATPTAISSRASAAGPSPSRSPAGPATDLFGLAPAPASRSRRRASAQAAATPATCGPFGSASLQSVALQRSLESRLHRLLAAPGSPEFALRWSRWAIGWGPPICALRAFPRPTDDSDYSGWPTPMGLGSKRRGPGQDSTLTPVARLAGYPTPKRRDEMAAGKVEDFLRRKCRARKGSKQITELNLLASLASYPTPRAEERMQANSRDGGVSLSHMASWATVAESDEKGSSRPGQRRRQLSEQAIGAVGSPSASSTAPRGVLNPALCRWLMGFPTAEDSLGAMGTRSSRRSRRRSSRPS